MPDPTTPDPAGTGSSPAGPSTDAPGAPTPGHFLPGGAGDGLAEGGTAMAGRGVSRQPLEMGLEMGKARAVNVDPSLQRKHRPLTTESGSEEASGYSGPPPAPLPNSPYIPLSGTRHSGGKSRIGWQSSPARPGLSQFTQPGSDTGTDFNQPTSRAMIISLAVILVAALTGGGIAGFRVIDSWGDTVDNPVSRPSAKKSELPLLTPPPPTVTKTVQPVPDLVRLRQNQLYKVGPVQPADCTEPKVKPDSQLTVLRFHQALLPCLNRTWAPVVAKAGYKFSPAKVVLAAKGATSCEHEKDMSYYCPDEQTLVVQWGAAEQRLYRSDPTYATVLAMNYLAKLYGFHVQHLTHILTASDSRSGWAKTETEALEWTRRGQLQADCLAGITFGANRQGLEFQGQRLKDWQYQEKHSGDLPKKSRQYGSKKNVWTWSDTGFTTMNPGSCNTYTAPPAKVS